MQLIKAKPLSDESIPYMTDHLDKILEDAMTYSWEGVRHWSEEVFTRVSLGRWKWSDTYVIDRLQSQLSHKTLLDKNQKNTSTPRFESGYQMSEELKKAKPGPPCKFFQTGSCSHSSDHVQNGYRQIHVCSYCLANKCTLLPHPSTDCKTKNFNDTKKLESGF